MTTRSHGSRVFHGSKEEVTPLLSSERFSYKLLQPQMYKRQPAQSILGENVSNKSLIYNWLAEHKEGSAMAIAEGIGVDKSLVGKALAKGVPGTKRLRKERHPLTGYPMQIWGVVEDA